MEDIFATIVVPTAGRPSSLVATIRTLCDQTYPRDGYEIVVVENGAKEVTRRAVAAVSGRRREHEIRYVYEPVPGLLAGRHRGTREGQGDILIFVDDDIDASRSWLEAMVAAFAFDPTIDLVGGRNLPLYETHPPHWVEHYFWSPPYGGYACAYLSLLDLGDVSLDVDANYIWGLNFGIRRKALMELGGFHPDNVPDDLQHFQGDGETGLTMKATAAGARAVYQADAVVHHRISRERLTHQYFERRARYQGVADSFTSIRRDQTVPLAPRIGTDAPIGDGSNDIHVRVAESYRAGFDFHQNAARRSNEILRWVLREDYWDYEFPKVDTTAFQAG